MNSIIGSVVKLYLEDYDSVFDMAADADYYEKIGYVVFCYGAKGNLISVSEVSLLIFLIKKNLNDF